MSHTCPECGVTCHCHGDIDDCNVEDEEYSTLHCTHFQKPDCIHGDICFDNYDAEDDLK